MFSTCIAEDGKVFQRPESQRPLKWGNPRAARRFLRGGCLGAGGWSSAPRSPGCFQSEAPSLDTGRNHLRASVRSVPATTPGEGTRPGFTSITFTGRSGKGHAGVERHAPPVRAAVSVQLPAQGQVGCGRRRQGVRRLAQSFTLPRGGRLQTAAPWHPAGSSRPRLPRGSRGVSAGAPRTRGFRTADPRASLTRSLCGGGQQAGQEQEHDAQQLPEPHPCGPRVYAASVPPASAVSHASGSRSPSRANSTERLEPPSFSPLLSSLFFFFPLLSLPLTFHKQTMKEWEGRVHGGSRQ